MRQHGSAFIMSPQELVSCDSTDAGCDGGWPTTAYDWIEQEGGLVAESDYPYTSGTAGASGTCDSKFETYTKLVTVTDYYTLRTETSMASYALATGPIAIAVDASAWSSYTGGILTKCGTSIDHAVQITGINLDQNYWKVKKSLTERPNIPLHPALLGRCLCTTFAWCVAEIESKEHDSSLNKFFEN